MNNFIFVTGSSDKVAEAERVLRIKLEKKHIELPEIQSVNIEEVVTRKVTFAYEASGEKPVIVEDTGLYIEAWNGLPGALVKWFIERVGVSGICRMMSDFANRQAWAKTVVATYDDGQLRLFSGRVDGSIADVPTGEGGFGWDSIFIPAGTEKTFGEMSPAEKDNYSMRRQAFESMASYYSALQD